MKVIQPIIYRLIPLIGIGLIYAFFTPLFALSNYTPQIEDSTEERKILEFKYGLDNRRTHIHEQNTLIYGAFIGLGIKERLRLKVGISGTPFEVGKSEVSAGITQRNRLYFLTLGEEFDVYFYKRFKLTTYFQMGYGYNDYRRLETLSSTTIHSGRHLIIPLEIGMHSNYYFYPWLSLKVGGGWRFVFPAESGYLSGYYLKLAFGFSTTKFLKAYRIWKAKRE